jgi:hypothetical protein
MINPLPNAYCDHPDSIIRNADPLTSDALTRLDNYTSGKTEFVATPDIKTALDEIAWLQAQLKDANERARFAVRAEGATRHPCITASDDRPICDYPLCSERGSGHPLACKCRSSNPVIERN